MMEMGIDRILFSVDYPFAENPPGAEQRRVRKLPRRLGRSDGGTEILCGIGFPVFLKISLPGPSRRFAAVDDPRSFRRSRVRICLVPILRKSSNRRL
jgi:hypothetical protein